MSDIRPFPEFISHKKLKSFLSNAPQEAKHIDKDNIKADKSEKSLNLLLKNWQETSESLVSHLRNNNDCIGTDKSSKSILALGAMEAHINMAIQALKAYKSDSQQ